MSSSSKQQQQYKQQADSFFQKQDYKKAIELYTQAIEVDPSCEAAAALFSNRSLCHHKLDNFEEALNDGVSATSIRPTWSRGYLRVANAAEALRQNEKALEAYEKCLELETTAEVKQKYHNLLKKHLENVSSTKTQDELKLFGNKYFTNQKYEEAILIYTAAIDLDPSVEAAAAIYSNRSASYYNINKFQEAYDDGSMASILRPEWPRGWLRRASAAVKIENCEDAHECYEKYFELDPEGAKQDSDAVKNKNFMKKMIVQIESEKKMSEERMNKLRRDLMSISDLQQRQDAARKALKKAIRDCSPTKFDTDSVRVVVECIPNMNQLETMAQLEANPPPDGDPVKWNSMVMNNNVLNILFSARLMKNFNKKVLGQLDKVILFVIEEMLAKNIPIPQSALCNAVSNFACYLGFSVPPNPTVVRALLQTGQVDPNEMSADRNTPLSTLIVSAIDLNPEGQVYPEFIASIDALLSWKGTDVNRRTNSDTGWQYPIIAAHHPDIVKLLLRHGANVNAECMARGVKTNALRENIKRRTNPHQAEIIRLLIAAGAKLIADGKNGKSSRTMTEVFDAENGHHLSEDCIRLLLQLNKSQGLDMEYRSPCDGVVQSFLITAIRMGATVSVIELLCGLDPKSVNVECKLPSKEKPTYLYPIEYAVLARTRLYGIDDCINVFRVLLNYGADLMLQSTGNLHKVFANIYRTLEPRGQEDTFKFFHVAEEKFGKEYVKKCIKDVGLLGDTK